MIVPCDLYPRVDIQALKNEYVGKTLQDIPTPAFVVDRSVMRDNCNKMLQRAKSMNASFRAHVKTHKSDSGVLLQLGSEGDCNSVVVSTLMEAWKLKPFYESGKIIDILYGLPVVKSRIWELEELSTIVPTVRLMIDNADQIKVLEEASNKCWSIFVKINMGTDRAGIHVRDGKLVDIINKIIKSKTLKLHGFYCHAGHSYSSKSEQEALNFLYQEIAAANEAAIIAKSIDSSLDLTISVGSTPTSHSSNLIDVSKLQKLSAHLELHAGNYPFCDLQQMATQCISKENVSCRVLTEVVSCYKDRGDDPPGEVLINAGVIALAREPGPLPGWGQVATNRYQNWIVGRISQEHGILVPLHNSLIPPFPPIGQRLEVIPQHSCITANAYPWYYITDGSDLVVDVWATWRGW